jgi:hypothetical protein
LRKGTRVLNAKLCVLEGTWALILAAVIMWLSDMREAVQHPVLTIACPAHFSSAIPALVIGVVVAFLPETRFSNYQIAISGIDHESINFRRPRNQGQRSSIYIDDQSV